ncbi:MAG: response regulator [Lachnospiraceae bacterium]|jgi:DNA-binding NarL/FixJ family response regulator|nr:response regulator [Lachnospiraceae bacterium]
MKDPTSLLILEDDPIEIFKFEEYIKQTKEIQIIKTTNSTVDAIECIENSNIGAAIIDLELHQGIGSGIEFLKKINEFQNRPIVIVTTNVYSNIIYSKIHEGLADIIFYKKQKDYSPKLVIDSLLMLAQGLESAANNEIKVQESNKIEIDTNQKLVNTINKELDLIGISYKLKGRDYIFDGIYYLIVEGNKKADEQTVFQYLSKKNKLLISSIGRAIQTAITHAWRTSPTEDLKENYTAKINYHTGVPTPTEFIYYYVSKIETLLKK